MLRLLLFGEFVDSHKFSFLIFNKLNILNNVDLGNYLQGITSQNTADFIWGTTSGARSLPIAILLSILKSLFQDNWYQVYAILCVILAFTSFVLAVRLLKKVDIFVIAGGLLFAFNYWIINWFTSGFWQIFIAYSILPFIVCIPIAYLRYKEKNQKILFINSGTLALIASIIITSQPHFLILVGLFLIMHLLITLLKSKDDFKSLISLYFMSLIFFIGINVYLIIPALFFDEIKFFPSSWYLNIREVAFNGGGAQLENILRLAPLKYPFASIIWTKINYIQILPLTITFIIFILSKQKKWLFFFNLLVCIFLAKGLNDPGSYLSELIYKNFYPLHFFRDPMRFVGGITLFASLLIATSRDMNKLNYKNIIFFITFIFIIILSNKNLFLHDLKIYVKPTYIPKEYVQVQMYINSLNEEGFRLAIVPNIQSFESYAFYNNPQPPQGTVYNMALPLKIPQINTVEIADNYSRQVSSFMMNSFQKDFEISKLNIFSAKYILIDSSIIYPDSQKKIATLASSMLNKNEDLNMIYKENYLTLYKYKTPNLMVNINEPIFAIGDFNTILKIKQKNSKRNVILLNQAVNSKLENNFILEDKELYIDYKEGIDILNFEHMSNEYSVDLLSQFWHSKKNFTICEPYKIEYVKEYGNLFTSGRCVRTWSESTDKIPIFIENSEGKYKIVAKVLTDKKLVKFEISTGNDKKIKMINTQRKLEWVDFGYFNFQDVDRIYIKASQGSPIIIDHLLVLPKKEFDMSYERTKSIVNSMNKITLNEVSESVNATFSANFDNDSISLKNPSKYLNYQFTWGAGWKTDKPSAKYISDGYAMSFISKSDKISQIEYQANRFYKLALVFSFIFSLSLVFTILYIYRKYKN